MTTEKQTPKPGYLDGGWKQKYVIEKADGSPVDPNAVYFVLRLDEDPNARVAATAYAVSVREAGNEELARDIEERVRRIEGEEEPGAASETLATLSPAPACDKSAYCWRDEPPRLSPGIGTFSVPADCLRCMQSALAAFQAQPRAAADELAQAAEDLLDCTDGCDHRPELRRTLAAYRAAAEPKPPAPDWQDRFENLAALVSGIYDATDPDEARQEIKLARAFIENVDREDKENALGR